MTTILRNEHPRPDRVRENWCTLNGEWDFAFDSAKDETGIYLSDKASYTHKIQVPFAYQSELSGINSQEHCDVVWYRRTFETGPVAGSKRLLLHFGAVDYKADVWLNGQYLGGHIGGYTPFSFDITHKLSESGVNTLIVRCEDRLDFDQPRGKQSFRPEPFGCWYTPVTGIWQSVWLETVGVCYPTDIRLTPNLEKGSIKAEITLNEIPACGYIRLSVSFKGDLVAQSLVKVTTDRYITNELYLCHDNSLEGFRPWSPSNPDLYDLRVETLCGSDVLDCVDTYFGMRKISIANGRILLNNHVLYQRLVLDQGYWPDGLLTAPSDEALKKDVEMTLAMGYNGARKHQKFEDPRYLYWADKLGLLVWGELPSAYWLRDSEKRNMMRDLSEAIARDYNHPCLITWVPLNESWGVYKIQDHEEAQKLAAALYYMVHSLDGTRIVSGNDGWENAATDIVTVHDYTAWPEQLSSVYANEKELLGSAVAADRMITAKGYDHTGKPALMTEYGGIAMAKDATGENWGYNGAVTDEKAFLERFEAITQAFKHMMVFQGYCYTQLTDVFQEVNGLMDMDRNPKASVEEIRRINLQR